MNIVQLQSCSAYSRHAKVIKNNNVQEMKIIFKFLKIKTFFQVLQKFKFYLVKMFMLLFITDRFVHFRVMHFCKLGNRRFIGNSL